MTTKDQVERIIRSNVSSKIHFLQATTAIVLLPFWFAVMLYYLIDIFWPVYRNDPQPFSVASIVTKLLVITVAAYNLYIHTSALHWLLFKYRTLHIYYGTAVVINYAFLADVPGAVAVSDMCSKEEANDKTFKILIETIDEMRASGEAEPIFSDKNPGLMISFFDYIDIYSLSRTEIASILGKLSNLSMNLRALTLDWVVFTIIPASVLWYWLFNLGLLLAGCDSPHTLLGCIAAIVFVVAGFGIGLTPLISAKVRNDSLESKLISLADKFPDAFRFTDEPGGMQPLLEEYNSEN